MAQFEPLLHQLDFDARNKIGKLIKDFDKKYEVEIASRYTTSDFSYSKVYELFITESNINYNSMPHFTTSKPHYFNMEFCIIHFPSHN